MRRGLLGCPEDDLIITLSNQGKLTKIWGSRLQKNFSLPTGAVGPDVRQRFQPNLKSVITLKSTGWRFKSSIPIKPHGDPLVDSFQLEKRGKVT